MSVPKGYWRLPQRAFVYCNGPCRNRIYYPGPDKPVRPTFCSDKCRQFAARLAMAHAQARQERGRTPSEEAFLETELIRVSDAMLQTEAKHSDLGDYAECAVLLAALQQRITRERT